MRNDYYIYRYDREDGSPYYIGKGCGNRLFRERRNFTPKDRNRIQIVLGDMTEEEAFELEIFLIQEIGRKDLGTGTLLNLTDGGEGVSGHQHSEESRLKMREAKLGRKRSSEVKRKMSESHKERYRTGQHDEDARRRKISEGNKGKTIPDHQKKKMSESARKRFRPPMSCLHCRKEGVNPNLFSHISSGICKRRN